MYKLKINDRFDFEVEKTNEDLLVNDQKVVADIQQMNGQAYHIINNLQSYNAEVISFDQQTKTAEIKVNGNIYTISAKNQFDILLDQLGLGNLNSAKISELKAPMPGLVLKLFINEGSEVKKGENLFTLEAMKMENIIKAPADVLVKTVKIKPGDKVEKGQVLLIF